MKPSFCCVHLQTVERDADYCINSPIVEERLPVTERGYSILASWQQIFMLNETVPVGQDNVRVVSKTFCRSHSKVSAGLC